MSHVHWCWIGGHNWGCDCQQEDYLTNKVCKPHKDIQMDKLARAAASEPIYVDSDNPKIH